MYEAGSKIEWHGTKYEVLRKGKKFYTLLQLEDCQYRTANTETTVYIKWIDEAATAA